jgi:hypothetical protein
MYTLTYNCGCLEKKRLYTLTFHIHICGHGNASYLHIVFLNVRESEWAYQVIAEFKTYFVCFERNNLFIIVPGPI